MGFNLRKNKADAANAAAPSGPTPVVSGSLKSDGGAGATLLRRNAIVGAILIGAAGIMAGGYYAYDISTSGGSGTAAHKVTPAGKAQDFAVPPPKTSMVPTPKPSGKKASTVPDETVQPQQPAPAPAPAQPAQPTPQQDAFNAAISGAGASISWQQNTTPGAAAATAPATAAGAATLPKPQTSVYSTHLVRKEVSPYELLQGTVIPATLETGIKSDLPGEITAVVSQPVYNSVSGAYVLIPAGSKLVGTYDSKVIAGATRVGVAWTRILFPNGTYMQIGGMPGASSRGYSGFHDLVNDHTWAIFKNALLLSLIDVGMSVASPTSATTTTGGITGNTALQDGEQSLAQTFGQAEAQIMQQSINIAPTLTIRPGYAFNVMVTKDLVFPGPYQHGVTETGPANPSSVAPATEANPYN